MRKILLFLMVTLILASCKDDASSKNKEIAIKMFTAFNTHEWEKMAGYYAESAEFLDPSFGKDYVKKTRKETIEKYKSYQYIIPDIKDELVSVDAVGDKVIVEFVSTGNIEGGGKLRLPIVSVLTFKDGLIVKDATYYDVQ